MQIAPSNARTAKNAPDGIANRRPAAPSRPNWRKSSRAGRAGLLGVRRFPHTLHTCEAKAQRASMYSLCFQGFGRGLRFAIRGSMKHAWLGCLLFGGLLFGGTQDSDINVNNRYVVDAVSIWGKGWKTTFRENHVDQAEQTQRLSSRLKADLVDLINRKLNPSVLDSLAQRIKRELSARE